MVVVDVVDRMLDGEKHFMIANKPLDPVSGSVGCSMSSESVFRSSDGFEMVVAVVRTVSSACQVVSRKAIASRLAPHA